jgi:hypothetical protein
VLRRPPLALALAVTLVAAGCASAPPADDAAPGPAPPAAAAPGPDPPGGPGGGDAGDAPVGPGGADPQGPQRPSPPEAALPDLEVVRVADGATVSLADLAEGDRPLLVWFWAPH